MFLPVLFFLTAQDWSAPARELARKVGRPDVISVTVRNVSSLPETDAVAARRAIESELHARTRQEGSIVTVTLSENVQSYLWVAEVLRGAEREVVMVNVARPDTPTSKQPLTVDKKLLWEQEKPILDTTTSGSLLIVLDTTGVVFYREGQLVSSMPISIPPPRDPRGRLDVSGDAFRALLPGAVCAGTISPPSMTCSESTGSGLVAGRNYFAGPPPYYSIAILPEGRIGAGVDGRARLADISISDWGSDIATIESGCGSGRQVLASKPTDASEPDAVQAYEVTGARVTAAGEPAQFPGPVTALWSSGKQAVAVTRIPDTGRYAAYSLSISCGR